MNSEKRSSVLEEGVRGRVKHISGINEDMMNTVQNIPLWMTISVTPSLFTFFVLFFSVVVSRNVFLCTAPSLLLDADRETQSQRAAWEQLNERAATHYSYELKKQNKQKETKLHQTLCYSWEKRASLLTCTIKASFAKRMCSPLFAFVFGDKRLKKRVSDRSCEFLEGGFGYWRATTRDTFVTRTDSVTSESV